MGHPTRYRLILPSSGQASQIARKPWPTKMPGSSANWPRSRKGLELQGARSFPLDGTSATHPHRPPVDERGIWIGGHETSDEWLATMREARGLAWHPLAVPLSTAKVISGYGPAAPKTNRHHSIPGGCVRPLFRTAFLHFGTQFFPWLHGAGSPPETSRFLASCLQTGNPFQTSLDPH